MKYRALLLDLDGTTVPSAQEGRPTKRVIDAVQHAKQYVKVAVATGRPWYLTEPVITALGIDQPCVVNGGAEIVDASTRKKLFHKYISVDVQQAVLKICQAFEIPLFTDTSQYEKALEHDDITHPTVSHQFYWCD